MHYIYVVFLQDQAETSKADHRLHPCRSLHVATGLLSLFMPKVDQVPRMSEVCGYKLRPGHLVTSSFLLLVL